MKFSTVPGQSALVSLYLSKQKYVQFTNLRLARYIILLDAESESKDTTSLLVSATASCAKSSI